MKDLESLKVAHADVNQVLAYSIKLGCSEAVLIYPFVTENAYSHDWNGTNVNCIEFDLNRSIEEGGELFLYEIMTKCTEVKEQVLL